MEIKSYVPVINYWGNVSSTISARNDRKTWNDDVTYTMATQRRTIGGIAVTVCKFDPLNISVVAFQSSTRYKQPSTDRAAKISRCIEISDIFCDHLKKKKKSRPCFNNKALITHYEKRKIYATYQTSADNGFKTIRAIKTKLRGD
ncbi:hypothetical protein PUN28_008985 [Cardiocondyla obscurior]|uniref:Uncharacterized protein n=1 Tax=Cardiocondyla obscurior TaxID=286306 RepID=A0AAW2FUZ1_9HYME